MAASNESRVECVKTALRERYERTARLDEEARLRECVEYLENPAILVAEFADSFLTAESYDQREQDFEHDSDLPRRRVGDRVTELLMGVPSVTVLDRIPYDFRFLAREIVPLRSELKGHDAGDRRAAGLEYVGVIDGEPPVPVLGVVQRANESSPYLALLRLLTCLAEVSTDVQMERANRYIFKDTVPQHSSFDLQILVAGPSAESASPLATFTKDLAHIFNVALKHEWQFPKLLRNISCLHIDLDDFDASLRVDWSV